MRKCAWTIEQQAAIQPQPASNHGYTLGKNCTRPIIRFSHDSIWLSIYLLFAVVAVIIIVVHLWVPILLHKMIRVREYAWALNSILIDVCRWFFFAFSLSSIHSIALARSLLHSSLRHRSVCTARVYRALHFVSLLAFRILCCKHLKRCCVCVLILEAIENIFFAAAALFCCGSVFVFVYFLWLCCH